MPVASAWCTGVPCQALVMSGGEWLHVDGGVVDGIVPLRSMVIAPAATSR